MLTVSFNGVFLTGVLVCSVKSLAKWPKRAYFGPFRFCGSWAHWISPTFVANLEMPLNKQEGITGFYRYTVVLDWSAPQKNLFSGGMGLISQVTSWIWWSTQTNSVTGKELCSSLGVDNLFGSPKSSKSRGSESWESFQFLVTAGHNNSKGMWCHSWLERRDFCSKKSEAQCRRWVKMDEKRATPSILPLKLETLVSMIWRGIGVIQNQLENLTAVKRCIKST